MTTFICNLFVEKEDMTKKKHKLGSLTNSMIDFLYLSEKKRKKKHGYDVNSYYKRIVDSVNQSFQDCRVALSKLPENQAKKIELLESYEGILRFATMMKIKTNLPDKLLKSAEVSVDNALGYIYKNDKELHELAKEDFARVKKWIRFFEPESSKFRDLK